MYSYSQLLMRNVILGMFFNILIIVMVSYFFATSLSSKQSMMQSSISAIIDTSDKSNQLEQVKLLVNLADFQLFSLQQQNKEIINYKAVNTNILVPYISPPIVVFTHSSNTTVSYQINSNDAATLILKIMLVSILASLIIIVIACTLSVKHTKKVVFVVNNKIKQ
ncbi:MAG: RNase E specificity factor CsrD, partial [Colwellia sp.]